MPIRTIRVPDWPWKPAVEKARREGTTISFRVRQFLERYVREDREDPPPILTLEERRLIHEIMSPEEIAMLRELMLARVRELAAERD